MNATLAAAIIFVVFSLDLIHIIQFLFEKSPA